MPRIFDNIDLVFHPHLDATLEASQRADFCVGYFNLRGWKLIDHRIDAWSGSPQNRCRLLVGMQSLPQDELRELLRIDASEGIDLQTAAALRSRVANEFREQLAFGAPSNADEAGLRRLATQLRGGKVVVRLYLREPMHAKLYLVHREDVNNPTIGFVGSSNLTFSGLRRQGELNVDVLDHDACSKLQNWFDNRWNDRFSIDISTELADIIDESWASPNLRSPYQIYIKMAYHLSQEARAGLTAFGIPKNLDHQLLEFQSAAVRIAAHHLNKRGGVIIGDVVGLGKTMMAVALARLFQEDQLTNTLIICPANLVSMWQKYVDRYGLLARVVSLGSVQTVLPTLERFRVVLIDESHNLRNREGKRYRVIRDYIEHNESRCILLSATPYNKAYEDLGSQLRLFVSDTHDLGVRPEQLIRELGETEFIRRYQAGPRTIAAFEHSTHPDDWRDLMRLYLVRRTRSFIEHNYAEDDPATGRRGLRFPDGSMYIFPKRQPRTVLVKPLPTGQTDPYERLYSPDVTNAIGALRLPRYGLARYLQTPQHYTPTQAETVVISRLSRGGARLMGFCKTNLYKRLESGGPAFLQSLYRHMLRNEVLLYALANGNDIPIGTLGAEFIDADVTDQDPDLFGTTIDDTIDLSRDAIDARAKQIHASLAGPLRNRFRWLPAQAFAPTLAQDLEHDSAELHTILSTIGEWQPNNDSKLQALNDLITHTHGTNKVIVFTQFADTVQYLERELKRTAAQPESIAAVTGDTPDPTAVASRFSPVSNEAHVDTATEIRVLIATDVLSEGQNLQDSHVIVNYDLPWAIVRLIQRAGRVDRLGQSAPEILCYSFLPVDGVEQLLGLRRRVRQRLQENAAVLGTDEQFFEDDPLDVPLEDLYNENAGILDGEADSEVDLASYAYQVWKNAIDADPDLAQTIAAMPPVSYATRPRDNGMATQPGVLVYAQTNDGNDSLMYVSADGQTLSHSQLGILRAAECAPDTPALPRSDDHHGLVKIALERISNDERNVGGQLGRPHGARFRSYERLKAYAAQVAGTLFDTPDLQRTLDDIYHYPLQQTAVDVINRQLRASISDEQLANILMTLRDDNRLSVIEESKPDIGPEIICSMGLV